MLKTITRILFFVLLLPFLALSQKDTILPSVNITEIEVLAPRIKQDLYRSPMAITRINFGAIQQTKQQLSFQEYITNVPGLFSLNANNYAQDLRISIRGFGARAAFGIRGVKIIVDGIPETTPDGQGQVDNLNLGIIDNIEIVKGPASSLYGNASGGIININTLSNFSSNFVEAGLVFGSFNMQQYQLKIGVNNKNTSYILQGNYTKSDGYRVQSGVRSTNLNARVLHRFSKSSKLNFQLNFTDSPRADDPGGINLAAVEEDREQARDRNVLFNTGEAIRQFKIGTNFSHLFNNGNEFESYAFYSNRDFNGKLPFEFGGLIELNRNYFGNGSSFNLKQKLRVNQGEKIIGGNQLKVGYDIAKQGDDRQRFRNLEGIKGAETLDQLESFSNLAFYILDILSFDRLVINAGLRYDWNQLEAEDNLLSNGDGSGSIKLSAFNPSIGLNYKIRNDLHVYTSYRTSFETPSLSELSDNPLDESGFNTSLKPQEASNIEVGMKAKYHDRFQFDITWFYIKTKNELVPFELEDFPDRNFFRNAGETNRNGLEFNSTFFISDRLSLTGSYTYSDFKYDNYILPNADLSGKDLPGIPKHYGTIALNHINQNGLNFQIQGRFIGDLFTNDENEVVDPSYLLVNASVGYELDFKDYKLSPFFGVNNLLDKAYNDNIRINAFGSRFYEPGPGINIYGGVRFRWQQKEGIRKKEIELVE